MGFESSGSRNVSSWKPRLQVASSLACSKSGPAKRLNTITAQRRIIAMPLTLSIRVVRSRPVGSDLLLKRHLQSSDPGAWITFRAVVRSIVHKPGQTQINRRGWPNDISRGPEDARNFTSLCYKLPAKKSQRLSRG